MWCQWASLDAFNAWHADACAQRGIPGPGERASDGTPLPDAQWTNAYVNPMVAGRVVIANVPHDVDENGNPITPDGCTPANVVQDAIGIKVGKTVAAPVADEAFRLDVEQ